MSTSGSSPLYPFSRDQKASVRLNYQHWALKELFGYLIHPSIPTNQAELHIADVATGTALWTIEVLRALPETAELQGFDISADQFPTPERLPKKIQLHVLDAFKPFPREHLARYDIVHIRLILSVIETHEKAEALARNLLTLLKPGGYLQWLELDRGAFYPIIPEGVDSKTTQKTLVLMNRPGPFPKTAWVPNLDKILAKSGFDNVLLERKAIPDELQTIFYHNRSMSFEDFLFKQLDKDASQEEERKVRDELDTLGREFAKGIKVHTEYVCVIGRNGENQ
ncbi:hypothetical protein N431DRAFT_465809 [Stipitochalara longipes BDJ]|nr:hypothetical protein N431DRAFT_465809 [Stipitochalara longipes BDJ]